MDSNPEHDFERIREQLPTPEELFSGIEDALGLPHRRSKLGLYILDGHEPVPIDDVLEWARFYENNDKRRVARTSINGWDVSTIFLGIDSNIFSSTPLLFETMIFSETDKVHSKLLNRKFRKSMETYGRRYSTWDEALAGHEEAVKMIREGAQ